MHAIATYIEHLHTTLKLTNVIAFEMPPPDPRNLNGLSTPTTTVDRAVERAREASDIPLLVPDTAPPSNAAVWGTHSVYLTKQICE